MEKKKKTTGADVLASAAATYRERNKQYGDNFDKVGEVMAILFPKGVTLKTAEDFKRWHLFDWMVGKMTRFAATDLKHIDSVHDLAVYAAILEAQLYDD